jgi:septum formation protein
MKLVLGSASPRRKELLSKLGFEFRVLTASCDESFDPKQSPEEIVLSICKKKIAALVDQIETDETLLCADTIVYLDGKVLGKPGNRDEAIEMLNLLSGKEHEVYTGLMLKNKQGEHNLIDCTVVRFQELKTEDINFYVDQFKPYDKAGSYGIQEWIGHVGVIEIRGSFTNVMGLPTQRLYPFLRAHL